MPKRRRHRSSKHETPEPISGRSWYAKILTTLLVAIPIVGTILYGAVDEWALIPLSFLGFLTLMLWFADSMRNGEVTYSDSLVQLPLIGMIVLGLIQLLPIGGSVDQSLLGESAWRTLSLDPFATRMFTIRLMWLAVYFAAVLAFLSDKKTIKRIAFAIVIFGGIIAFFGIIQRLGSPDAIYGMRSSPDATPFGPFVNQHHFAGLMEMTGGMTLALILGDTITRDRKPLFIIAGMLMAVAVVLTGSRGGMISMLGVAAFVLAARYFLGRRHRDSGPATLLRAALGTAVAVIAVTTIVLMVGGTDQLVRGTGLSAQADVSTGRTHFWWIALQIFFAHPILGAGLESFRTAFSQFDTWNGTFAVERAHNEYLQALADGGIIGLALVGAFIYLLLNRGFSLLKHTGSPTRKTIAIGAMAGAFGILVHSFFDFPLRTPSNAYFFLLLVGLAIVRTDDERERTRRSNRHEQSPA